MISATALAAFLGIDEPSEQQLADLQARIDGATASLGRELGIFLGLPAETEEIIRVRGRTVPLADTPAAEPAVVVEQRMYPGDPWVAIESTEYVVEGRALRFGWPPPPWVRVTYTRGYAVNTGPLELRDLVRDLAAQGYTDHLSGIDSRMQSESIGDYSYTRADVEGFKSWPGIVQRWGTAAGMI